MNIHLDLNTAVTVLIWEPAGDNLSVDSSGQYYLNGWPCELSVASRWLQNQRDGIVDYTTIDIWLKDEAAFSLPLRDVQAYGDPAPDSDPNWGRSAEDCTSIFGEGNDLDSSDAFDSWVSGDYHC